MAERKTKAGKSVDAITEKVIPILERHNALRARLFGSLVAGEERPDSDVDILVKLKDDVSLLDYIGIKLEVEDALGRKVDLVEYGTLKPLLKDKILRQQVSIL